MNPWGALALLAGGLIVAGGAGGAGGGGSRAVRAEVRTMGGVTLVIAPASSLRAVLGGTAATALTTRAAATVACGPMYDRAGPQYGLRDVPGQIATASRYPTRGGTLAVVDGRAVVSRGWDPPAGATVAVQGYPQLVVAGAPVAVRDDESRTGRVAVGVMADGRVALCAFTGGLADFARELARVGLRDALYLDGGTSATLRTNDGQVMREGREASASWLTLGAGEVATSGISSGPGDVIELPGAYARSKVNTLARRLANARSSWARWGAVWMPGAPIEACVAISATSSGPTERGGPPDYVIGSPNVEAEAVRRWRRDGSLRRDLGRDLDPDNAARYAADQDGQIYCGLRSYAEHLRDLAARTGGLVEAAPSRWDAWAYRLAVMAYVVGNSGAAAQLAPIAPQLAALPRDQRWGLLSRSIAAVVGDRWGSRPVAGKWRAAHAQLRTDGRWACGRELAREVGSPLAWWGEADEATWIRLERRAEGA